MSIHNFFFFAENKEMNSIKKEQPVAGKETGNADELFSGENRSCAGSAGEY